MSNDDPLADVIPPYDFGAFERSITFEGVQADSLAILLGGAHPVAAPGEVSLSFQQTVPSRPPAYYPPRGWRRWVPGATKRALADQERRTRLWYEAGCPPVLVTTLIPRATIMIEESGTMAPTPPPS